tara:strand:+ start:2484 stop:2678 length:195 start_codon:yes stop_codon:yes gene_type:complete
METLNLGEAIAQLKVLRWQYEEANDLEFVEAKKNKSELVGRIMETIDMIDVPELIGQGGLNEYL